MKLLSAAIALLIVSLLASATVPASDLVLNHHFLIQSLREMPAARQAGVRYERRNYVFEQAVEWQCQLQAPAEMVSPLYEDLKAADFVLQLPFVSEVDLHYSRGSHANTNDFQPLRAKLWEGEPIELESFGGRSSDGVMPYFNVAGAGGGLIVAIGWPGDWRATFESLGEGQVKITAGLKRSRFHLAAGESLRAPSILLMSYRGKWIDGQNQFRRLMLTHFTPQHRSLPELMPLAASVHGLFGFNATSEENLTKLAKEIGELDLRLDTFWLDAGWNQGGFPGGQGNAEADRERFPHGLAPLGKVVKSAGMKFLVWFEPERAMRASQVEREHPQWLLRPSNTPPELAYMEKDGFALLDLSNAEARGWALDQVSRCVREANLTFYRQDFNLYPAYYWHTDESPEEIGLKELRYINGLYAFLDELQRRHPKLIIDNCASGGRRLDFEMMRRSVVLWRSDSCWDDKTYPRNVQAMTHGLSLWLPLHGLGSVATDDVSLRSGMGACGTFATNFRDPRAVESLRKHLDRYRPVRQYFTADYYPLTKWSSDPEKWLAFQFHDREDGSGIVQAFCGPTGAPRRTLIKLEAVDQNKRYMIRNWDEPGETEHSGYDLLTRGIEVSAPPDRDGAVVLEYATAP